MSFPDTLNVKCINELAIREKRVFIRADFDIPFDDQGSIADVDRIRMALPTIKHALEHNARVIIAGHAGDPDDDKDPSFSLEPVAAVLAELLDKEIYFFEDCSGMGAQQMVRDLKPGHILVLENLRYNEEEKKNSSSFARELAKMCDIYINDAFGVSHRKETSVNALPHIIDNKGIGFHMKKEIEEALKLADLKRGDGFYAVFGGSRVTEKIAGIKQMLEVADKILLCGEVSHTFLAALGVQLGNTKIDEERISAAKEVLKRAEVRKIEIVLPVDHVAAESINSTETVNCANDKFKEGLSAFDIGPKTVKLFKEKLAGCRHVFWSGPAGCFEKSKFLKGSTGLAKAVVSTGAVAVAGGSETYAVIRKSGVFDKFSHVSTGSGAVLEIMKNRTLPGVDVLK